MGTVYSGLRAAEISHHEHATARLLAAMGGNAEIACARDNRHADHPFPKRQLLARSAEPFERHCLGVRGVERQHFARIGRVKPVFGAVGVLQLPMPNHAHPAKLFADSMPAAVHDLVHRHFLRVKAELPDHGAHRLTVVHGNFVPQIVVRVPVAGGKCKDKSPRKEHLSHFILLLKSLIQLPNLVF